MSWICIIQFGSFFGCISDCALLVNRPEFLEKHLDPRTIYKNHDQQYNYPESRVTTGPWMTTYNFGCTSYVTQGLPTNLITPIKYLTNRRTAGTFCFSLFNLNQNTTTRQALVHRMLTPPPRNCQVNPSPKHTTNSGQCFCCPSTSGAISQNKYGRSP